MKDRTEPSDAELLQAHQEGDSQTFAELVRRYHKDLYQFMTRMTGQATLAEDLVQETFLQVHISAKTFDLQRRFKPWLFAIAANKARDALRKQARRPALDLDALIQREGAGSDSFADIIASTAPLPEEQAAKKETQLIVQQLLMEMPSRLREIIILVYYHRFAYKQVAETLDIPLGTVKSRLHTAVAHLAKLWHLRAGPDDS